MLHVPAVSNEFANLLREARTRRGLTQQQLADAIGVSRPAVGQWEGGTKLPSTGHLMKLAIHLNFRWEPMMRGELVDDERPLEERGLPLMAHSFLGKPLDLALAGRIRRQVEVEESQKAYRKARGTSNVRLAPGAPIEALSAQVYLPLDVPVFGVSMGGDGHDFHFNGQTVDYVRRPLGIANARQAYATYVVGESMVPAFREGAVLFVNPDKPPSIGDDVVIEMRPDADGEPGAGYIKRLKKRTASKIVVVQFNPPQDLEFDMSEVRAMHRVVPWNELLGI